MALTVSCVPHSLGSGEGRILLEEREREVWHSVVNPIVERRRGPQQASRVTSVA